MHCVKYARIRVFADPCFPVYGQNQDDSSLYGKIRVSKNSYSFTFYAVMGTYGVHIQDNTYSFYIK